MFPRTFLSEFYHNNAFWPLSKNKIHSHSVSKFFSLRNCGIECFLSLNHRFFVFVLICNFFLSSLYHPIFYSWGWKKWLKPVIYCFFSTSISIFFLHVAQQYTFTNFFQSGAEKKNKTAIWLKITFPIRTSCLSGHLDRIQDTLFQKKTTKIENPNSNLDEKKTTYAVVYQRKFLSDQIFELKKKFEFWTRILNFLPQISRFQKTPRFLIERMPFYVLTGWKMSIIKVMIGILLRALCLEICVSGFAPKRNFCQFFSPSLVVQNDTIIEKSV